MITKISRNVLIVVSTQRTCKFKVKLFLVNGKQPKCLCYERTEPQDLRMQIFVFGMSTALTAVEQADIYVSLPQHVSYTRVAYSRSLQGSYLVVVMLPGEISKGTTTDCPYPRHRSTVPSNLECTQQVFWKRAISPVPTLTLPLECGSSSAYENRFRPLAESRSSTQE